MLEDRIGVAEHHGEAHRTDHLGGEVVESEHVDEVHAGEGSGPRSQAATDGFPRTPDTLRRPMTVDLRSPTRFVALWVFGLATSLLLGALWGRQVSGDRATLEATVETAVVAELVEGRIEGWLTDGIAAASGLPHPEAAAAMEAVVSAPETGLVVERLSDQLVAALLAPPGAEVSIDVAAALDPVVPVVAAELRARDVPADEAAVHALLDTLEPVVLDDVGPIAVPGTAHAVRTFLTRVVVVAFAVQLLAAAVVVGIAADRREAMRTLAIRLGMSAASYAVLFRLGSWALDPRRGRAPVAAGGSVLLGSHLWVFVAAGAVAGLVVVAARRRPRPTSPAGEPSRDVDELVGD